MNIEEIAQGLAENSELKTQLLEKLNGDVLEHVKGKGYVLRTTDEETSFLKKYEDEKIRPRVEELYGNIDKDVFEASGIPRDTAKHPKTYDYVKGVINELKSKGVTDEATRQRIVSLETELETARGAVSQKDQEFASERMAWKVGKGFDNAFADLKIAVPAGIPDKEATDYVANKRQMLQSALLNNYDAVEQDGKIVYKKKGGDTFEMTGGNFATEKDLLTGMFKYDFETAPNRRGTGTSSSGADSSLATVSDKEGLYKAAAEKGLVKGSADWIKFVTEAAQSKNIKLS